MDYINKTVLCDALQLVLIVGAKLQHIIIGLAIEVRGGVKKIDLDDLDDGLKKADHGTGIEVQPMKPRDDLFWFSRPRLLLTLIHLILFQVHKCSVFISAFLAHVDTFVCRSNRANSEFYDMSAE